MGPDLVITAATEDHARELAPRMRRADAAEVLAASGLGPLDALLDALEHSTVARAGFIAGDLASMWGVCQHQDDDRVGVAWLLSSDVVERHRRAFLRACRAEMGQLLERWPVLISLVDARHTVALRWLQLVGFTVGAAVPYGPDRLPFHSLCIRRP